MQYPLLLTQHFLADATSPLSPRRPDHRSGHCQVVLTASPRPCFRPTVWGYDRDGYSRLLLAQQPRQTSHFLSVQIPDGLQTERSLLRRFRKATGQSPVDYIQTLRIEEAKQMLETTDMPIVDIAAEVGYTKTSSFRNAFRRYVGMPASTYRKKRLSWFQFQPIDWRRKRI